MAIVPVALAGGIAIGVSASTLYVAPSGTRAVVKRAVFSNVSGAAANVSLSVTRSGGSPVGIVTAQNVASSGTFVSSELANLVLMPGDAVNASASTAGVINAFLSGFTFA